MSNATLESEPATPRVATSISRPRGRTLRRSARRTPSRAAAWTPHRHARRRGSIALGCVVVAAALLVAGSAWAGTYLDRATLVIRGASEEAEYLRHRLANRELARIVHHLSQTRLEVTRTTEVPKEVSQAHPHLLLMLENYERAADAAVAGQSERFLIYQGRARDEEQIFRSILHQLGFPLTPPKPPR